MAVIKKNPQYLIVFIQTGIVDGAVIKEGKALGRPSPDRSELRNNIEKNTDLSYYYAHANETPLPESLRYVAHTIE